MAGEKILIVERRRLDEKHSVEAWVKNIYRHFQQGKRGLLAAIAGAHEVTVPVIFAVLTSVAAFSPLLTIPGTMGKFMKIIPQIVIATLIFSLVESLLILPAHLAHSRMNGEKASSRGIGAQWNRFQDWFSNGLRRFTVQIYRPYLELALRWRYLTVAIAVLTLLLTVGLIGGGRIKFLYFPDVDADNVVALLTMPQGTPVEVTAQAVRRLEESVVRLREEIDGGEREKVFRHVLTSVGEQLFRTAQNQNSGRIAALWGHIWGKSMSSWSPQKQGRSAARRLAGGGVK